MRVESFERRIGMEQCHLTFEEFGERLKEYSEKNNTLVILTSNLIKYIVKNEKSILTMPDLQEEMMRFGVYVALKDCVVKMNVVNVCYEYQISMDPIKIGRESFLKKSEAKEELKNNKKIFKEKVEGMNELIKLI